MRSISLSTILLLIFSISSFSQGLIVLKNGDEIQYSKFKQRDDKLVVNIFDAGKEDIAISKVAGYYDFYEAEFYYCKPFEDYSITLDMSRLLTNSYQFMKRVVTGTINIYQFERQTGSSSVNPNTGMMSMGTNTTYVYIEKGNHFELMLPGSISHSKKESRKVLEELVSDQAIVLAMVDENFQMKYDNIEMVVKAYNLATYSKKEISNLEKNANVIVYRRDKKQMNKEVPLQVNDSTIQIGVNEFTSIKLPSEVLTKICIGSNTNCDLFEGSPFSPIYYELRFDKSGAYKIERKSKKEAEFYIQVIKNIQEKERSK